MKNLLTLNRILLGLLMLVAGLIKIFVTHADKVAEMLSKIVLFSWAPMVWAWILIIGEIGSGLAVIANWKIKYTALIPALILIVAIFTVTIKWATTGTTNWTNLIFHLIAINAFLILSVQARKNN
jgi:uncharacterized membrane protein YphA (DoxX/SURF4 family)